MRKDNKNVRTISEAICVVLMNHPEGLTNREIYQAILDGDLYFFSAKNPLSVVLLELRRHCEGVEISFASKDKKFCIVSQNGTIVRYGLIGVATKQGMGKKPFFSDEVDSTEEEKIINAYRKHKDQIGQMLLEKVMNSSPAFFEQLVVDLLMKMGYGNDETSGIVTGKSHDQGIDGVINEDKLGLDKIYIQAKRYSVNTTVGSKELQAFVGAMQGITKGVFITSSSFTKEALKYHEKTKQSDKHLVLIDGDKLVDLLIDYEVGIRVKDSISIFDIDQAYFE